MNSQEESLTRRLPIQLVAYHIHLRILHSGLSAEQVLALPEDKFGQFIAECLQITRDAGLVPYQSDETLTFQCTATGELGLGLRGTEDMVFHIVGFHVCIRTIDSVLCHRDFRVAPINSWDGPSVLWLDSRSPIRQASLPYVTSWCVQ